MLNKKTFLAVDPATGETAYTHGGEAFKKPYTDDNGVLHWYGYAPNEILSKSPANLDDVFKQHFDDWCKKYNFAVGERRLIKTLLTDYDVMEYEFLAPLMENA